MRVLLVDHDSEALDTVARAIRGVLELDCVTSKGDALLLLRQNTYDVLIACERAIDGSGLDLLGRTTRTAVPLKRIFAAAPERLQLLGPRLAPFKVQRTINYPIDLEELWLAIAQVTSGPDDETDGTIERVVLDERGIPSAGTVARAPIPPRPPAPLSVVPQPASAISSAASGGRATARLTQPAPEPPLRAPPPPRAPPAARPPAAPAQVRVTQPALQPIPPMPFEPADAPTRSFADWTPELPTEEDFAQVAAQARLGVQQKIVDEASRRKRQRLLAAGGIAVVVAGAIVLLIEKFYDPVARAREQAIAAEVSRMTEQQKVTDDLTLIEIDIENAIMNNDLDAARRELAKLIEKSPDHPRREFLQASIDRAAELAKLSPQTAESRSQAASAAPAQAAVMPAASERVAPARPRTAERPPVRTAERVTARASERTVPQRQSRDTTPIAPRTYGAPISEPPHLPTIALDSPINAPPTTTARRSDNSFGGRTIEASDGSGMRTPTPTQPPVALTKGSPSSSAAGSAAVVMPPVAAPAPAPPAPVDVTPAKLVKRVTPVAPGGIPRKTAGYVVVRFTINESGRVADLAVVESQPQGVFDDAAQDAVRKWIYEPRKENGVAVQQPAKARLVFEAAN